MESDGDELTGRDGLNPWPALADLMAASTLLFLILFAAMGVPAMRSVAIERDRSSRLESLQDSLKNTLSDTTDVSVKHVGDYLLVSIRGKATFPKSRFELRELQPQGKAILRSFGVKLIAPAVAQLIDQVQVVGHASSEGSEETNWVLSASRAATVSLFLIDSVGLSACSVSALGRSRYYPLDPIAARGGTIDPNDRRIELEIHPVIPHDSAQKRRKASCVEAPRR